METTLQTIKCTLTAFLSLLLLATSSQTVHASQGVSPSPTTSTSSSHNVIPQRFVFAYLISLDDVCGGVVWGDGHTYDITGNFLGMATPNGLIVNGSGQVVGWILGDI
jgi:hypothetical protein